MNFSGTRAGSSHVARPLINVLEEYPVLDHRSLQPPSVLPRDRDDADFINTPLPGKSLDLLGLIPAEQLLDDPTHGLVVDAPAKG